MIVIVVAVAATDFIIVINIGNTNIIFIAVLWTEIFLPAQRETFYSSDSKPWTPTSQLNIFLKILMIGGAWLA